MYCDLRLCLVLAEVKVQLVAGDEHSCLYMCPEHFRALMENVQEATLVADAVSA